MRISIRGFGVDGYFANAYSTDPHPAHSELQIAAGGLPVGCGYVFCVAGQGKPFDGSAFDDDLPVPQIQILRL